MNTFRKTVALVIFVPPLICCKHIVEDYVTTVPERSSLQDAICEPGRFFFAVSLFHEDAYLSFLSLRSSRRRNLSQNDVITIFEIERPKIEILPQIVNLNLFCGFTFRFNDKNGMEIGLRKLNN